MVVRIVFITNGCKCFEGYRVTPYDMNSCKRNCTTHGTCVHNSQCVCDRGYAGLDCNTTFVCNPMNCSGHGVCNGPMKCACEEGWIGNDCSMSLCGDSCDLLHGKCRANRICECKQGWGGPDCSCRSLPKVGVCSGRGMCAKGECFCDASLGYGGKDCNEPLCKNMCAGHGECLANRQCDCEEGWGGSDCSERACQLIALTMASAHLVDFVFA